MLVSITDQLAWASVSAATKPATPDPDLITPGVIGFVVTFLIAVAAVLLIFDMVRRVRRVNYRDEIRERLLAEQAADEAAAATDATETDDESVAAENGDTPQKPGAAQ